ncbi:MAG TPA: hypothetical protein VI299_00310 [Polyangiales bacterium]
MKARLVAALLAVATACGDDGAHDAQEIPCDISQERCRNAIFGLTARIREQRRARMPPSRIITRDQYADETRKEIAMQMVDDKGRQYEQALRLLKLLPEGSSAGEAMADSNIEGVAAYYASDTKAVTIIADAAEDAYSGSLTLSHEYVHALQDEREGLDRVAQTARSTDQIMAETSLIEGEATILSDAAMSEAQGLDYDYAGSVSPYLDRLLKRLLMDIADSPAPFTEGQFVLPYPVGGRPLAIAYDKSGAPGVAAYFKERPDTLAEWIDPTRSGLPAAQRCASPDAPAGYARIGLDSFGATGLIALEVVAGADGPTAYENARAWAADSVAVFAPLDQSIQAAVAWRITLIDPSAAAALATRLSAKNLGLALAQQGAELVITAASAPDVMASWTVRDECSTTKSLEEPSALWPQLPRYFGRLMKQSGAEGGTRTRMP